jgi:hypothetical protein
MGEMLKDLKQNYDILMSNWDYHSEIWSGEIEMEKVSISFQEG